MSFAKLVLAAGAAISLTGTAAIADVVCNDEGDCWHVHVRHVYRPEYRLHVYPDDWNWSDEEATTYRWREHEGGGYWREGLWIEF